MGRSFQKILIIVLFNIYIYFNIYFNYILLILNNVSLSNTFKNA